MNTPYQNSAQPHRRTGARLSSPSGAAAFFVWLLLAPLAATAQQPGAEEPTPPPPRPDPAAEPPPRPEAAPQTPPSRPAEEPDRARVAPRPPPRRQVWDTERPEPETRKAPRPSPPRSDGSPSEALGDKRSSSPVVRAAAGDWGMFFRFGGLADLYHGGNSRTVSGMVFTQVGFKAVVSEHFIVPLYFGTGYRLYDANSQYSNNRRGDFGFEVGVSLEWHFRIWRRISPFIALNFGLGLTDPSGTANWTFGLGLGPAMGVEYYIGDRVSLTAMYLLNFQFEFAKAGSDNPTTFQVNTIAGGALNMSYYF